MENKEVNVEIVDEPKIESRFGFSNSVRNQSSKTIKYCSIVVGVTLIGVLLLKSPEKASESNSEIKPPDVGQLGRSSDKVALDTYSSVQENERIKEQNKNRGSMVIVRLPGLQKIDRRQKGQIPPGSLVRAVLVTGASNGPVRAEIKEDLRIQGETLVPEGAILLGSGRSTEERLTISFSQMVFKDGSFVGIQAQAADAEDKTVGLKGSKVGRYALKYGAAIGLNFVGGMAEGLQDRKIVGQEVVTKADARNALLNGTSKATLEMANQTMNDIKNSAPIIEVEAGKEIYVIFEGSR